MRWRLFDTVPEEEVQRVLAIARRRTYKRGEVVFHLDDLAETVHLVVSGRFAVRVHTPVGDVAILTVLGPGDIFGELALLDPEARRTATVEAIEAGETRTIRGPDFDRLRREHPGVTDVLVAILAETTRRLSRHLVEALYVPADVRVLRRLVDLAEVYAPGGGEAVITLRQEDLAGLAGTSRATANRVLREEEARGAVRLARGQIAVLDRDALRRRARLV